MSGFSIGSHIVQSGKQESRRWFDLSDDLPIDGFEVELAFISKHQIEKWTRRATKMVRNPQTKKKEPRLDNDTLFALYAKYVVKDWRGLDVGKLKMLVHLTNVQEIPEDLEVECTEENVIHLLKNALELDDIITNLAIDPSNFVEGSPANSEEEDEAESDFRGGDRESS